VNSAHVEFLSSPAWTAWLERELLPWISSVGDLGGDVIEVGPGPGLTTDLLRSRARRVTAVEIDDALAAALAERMGGTNMEVIHADGTKSGLPSDRYSSAACFSMLHHIPSPATQDELFREMHRLLAPGGRLFACDSQDLDVIRVFHEGDTFVPIAPETIETRLTKAGFTDIALSTTDFEVRFSARKPL